jgi:PhnB protein
MQITPYLFYGGTCRAAFEHYAKVLGGEIVMMISHADAPEGEAMPGMSKDSIMHARLKFGTQLLMGSDSPPDRHKGHNGFDVNVTVANVEDAERIFQGLAEGGKVMMPIGETFWAARFGALVDKFGVPWMVNCDKPAA